MTATAPLEVLALLRLRVRVRPVRAGAGSSWAGEADVSVIATVVSGASVIATSVIETVGSGVIATPVGST